LRRFWQRTMSTEYTSHGQTGNGRPVHGDVSFEKTDVRVTPILKFLVYLAILVIASYALTYGIYVGLERYWASTYTPPVPSQSEAPPILPPEPRMQGMPGHLMDPQEDHREKLRADREANNRLSWLDEKAGIAQIPVSDAMQIIVEKGLPAVTPPPAEKK
jgi:hypothetical protein